MPRAGLLRRQAPDAHVLRKTALSAARNALVLRKTHVSRSGFVGWSDVDKHPRPSREVGRHPAVFVEHVRQAERQPDLMAANLHPKLALVVTLLQDDRRPGDADDLPAAKVGHDSVQR